MLDAFLFFKNDVDLTLYIKSGYFHFVIT
jgi:hypothetical protein